MSGGQDVVAICLNCWPGGESGRTGLVSSASSAARLARQSGVTELTWTRVTVTHVPAHQADKTESKS